MRHFFVLCLLAVPAFGQTPEQVKAAVAAFREERAAALKSFSKEELAMAEELFAKAEAANAAGNTASALRLVSEARWQVPFVPAGAPEHVIRILGAGRLRHGDRVNAIAYSPDGSKLVSASRDGTVRIWDIGNGRELLAYRGHLDQKLPADAKENTNVLVVGGVAYSADGEWIASAGGSEIHIWEAKTGKRVHTLKGLKGPFKSVAFFKDKNVLLSGGDDRRLAMWDVPGEKTTFVSDASEDQALAINAVAISPTEKQIASVNHAGGLVVYSLAPQPKLVLSLGVSDEGRQVQSLVFSRDGNGIYTAGNDRKAKLVAGSDGMPGSAAGTTVRKYEGHNDAVHAIALTPNGKSLVTGSNDRSVIVWDAATGKIQRVYQGHMKEVTCVAIRPDGLQIASASEDGSIRLWPLTNSDEHKSVADASDNLWTVAYSPDGRTFATGGADRKIRVYDTNSGKLLNTLEGHKGAVTAIVFLTPNKLASTSGDKTLKIWDVAAGTAKDCIGHTSAVLCAALGGQWLLTGGTDKTVRGWNASTGELAFTWAGKSAVCSIAVRKDGGRIAVGCASGEVILLEADGTKEPKVQSTTTAHSAGVASLAFTNDGDRLATAGGDGIVRLWNIGQNTAPAQLTKFDQSVKTGTSGTAPVTAIAFSADDKQIVGGGAEGVVRIWDVATIGEVRVLRAHTGWVTGVAYAPDGRTVLSCSVDKTARVFELPRSESSSPGHMGKALSIAVSRDGKYAATGSEDKTVIVWDLATGREIATLSGSETHVSAVTFVGKDKVAGGTASRTSSEKMRVWDFTTGREVFSAPTASVVSIAASEDGKRIGLAWAKGTSDNGSEGGFDVFQGLVNTPNTLKGGIIRAAAISPDATWGATGDKDGIIRLWNLEKKDRLGGDWPILKNAIADIGFTPDRKFVVVIDDTGEVKVADVAKREVTATVKAVSTGVNGVCVAPTGNKFATLSATGEVKVWDMNCKELRKWQLPFAANAAVFTIDGKKLLTANADGTAYVLEIP